MWDDRIDETAHELTQGSPGGDFKARVLERIELEGAAILSSQRRLVWITAVSVAAVLLVMLTQYRGAREANDVAHSAAERIEPTWTSPPSSASPSQRLAPASPRRVSGQEPPIAVEPPVDDEAIRFEPLTIVPIDITAVDPVAPEIPPLTLSAIDIPALDH